MYTWKMIKTNLKLNTMVAKLEFWAKIGRLANNRVQDTMVKGVVDMRKIMDDLNVEDAARTELERRFKDMGF